MFYCSGPCLLSAGRPAGYPSGSSTEDLPDGAVLVCCGKEPGFTACGQLCKRKRPHMRLDDLSFFSGDPEIPFRILSGYGRMMIAVQLVSEGMPVIEVVIMQERRSHQALLVGAKTQAAVQAECRSCHVQAVLICRSVSVLDITPQFPEPGVSQIWPADPAEVLFVSVQ